MAGSGAGAGMGLELDLARQVLRLIPPLSERQHAATVLAVGVDMERDLVTRPEVRHAVFHADGAVGAPGGDQQRMGTAVGDLCRLR